MDFPTLPITAKRILVVDSDTRSRKKSAQALEIEGYEVFQAENGNEAQRFLERISPDLIVSDINTPGGNGADFYQVVRNHAAWTTIPFIFFVTKGRSAELQRAQETGVEDVIFKPIESGNLARIVHARLMRSAELKYAFIDQAYLETVEVIASTVEGRDAYTHGHIGRVSLYLQWLAEAMDWPADKMRILAFGARLHDIGKIVIPDHILKKPGDLTAEEWEEMKKHPIAGAKIINKISFLKPAVNYILYHHERWDGSGYPHGLVGREIPLEGRMLAIADVFDALTTDRPYHPACTRGEALQFLVQQAGVKFDPDLVPIFVKAVEERMRD